MQINDVDLDKGTVNVAEYSKADAAISELRQQYADISRIDPDNDDDYAFLKAGIKKVAGYRTALEKKRKEIKAPFLDAGRIIDNEAKRITAALVELEDPMKTKKAIRDEREKREKEERIARLEARIQREITDLVIDARGADSNTVAGLIERLDQLDPDLDFYDRTQEAHHAKAETMAELSRLYTEKLSFERAEAERQEQERINRELREQQERERRLNDIRNAPMSVFGKSAAEIREKRKAMEREFQELAYTNGDEHVAYDNAINMLDQMLMQAQQLEAAAPKQELNDNQPVIDSGTAAIFCQPSEENAFPDPDCCDYQPMPVRNVEPTADDELVTITRREYEELLAESRMLAALVAAGVEDWPGYDEARATLGLSESPKLPF